MMTLTMMIMIIVVMILMMIILMITFRYADGGREGTCDLYAANSFPQGMIAPVRFMWRQKEAISENDEENESAMIWIWVHASAFTEALEHLQRSASGHQSASFFS